MFSVMRCFVQFVNEINASRHSVTSTNQIYSLSMLFYFVKVAKRSISMQTKASIFIIKVKSKKNKLFMFRFLLH